MHKNAIRISLFCTFILLAPIIYNFNAILIDVRNNSFDLLRKNAATSGLAIEKIASEFQEDLAYLISTRSLPSLLNKDEIDNDLLVHLKRFYSKHKNLISSIVVHNESVYRIFQQGSHNYFEVSPRRPMEGQAQFFPGRRDRPDNFQIIYEKQIMHGGKIQADIQILLNIPLLARDELKKYYTMSNSWYWLIDGDKQIVTALYSEGSVKREELNASGLDAISNAVKNNFEGTIDHALTNGKRFSLLTAYYPIKVFNKRYGVLFSADKSYVFRAVTHRTIIITACFTAMILLVVISFLFIIKQQKKAEALLTIAKQELEEKVRERTVELQESEEKYRLLFEQSEDPMLLIDDDRYVMANQAAVRIFGYSSPAELIGTHPAVHSPENQADGQVSSDKADEMMALGYSHGYHRFEWQHQHQNGAVFPVEISLTRVPYRQSDALFCVWRDISERKQAEDERVRLEMQLQQSQKMEAIGLMAGGVAHDLNNILAGIVGYPELILMKLDTDSPLRKPLQAIMDSGERAATVVADLLTISRDAASAREIQDLNVLITEYLDSPEFEKLKLDHPKTTYRLELAAEAPSISCSPVHIKKCLMNLVTNAAEVIEGFGTVTISSCNRAIEETASPELEAGTYVVLGVRDNGTGIPAKDLNHIFEPFYTKKVMGRSGTGLGLTVVWNTVKDHGGSILVESSEEGTTFQLFFPASMENARALAPPDPAGSHYGNGERILVIDDEPHLRDIACRMLESLGYEVDSVSSGESALAFLKDTAVDLLVLDMLMDPGINGRRTYEEIIKLHPGQKAVIASGFSISEDVKATLRLGAGSFIKKPYSVDRLGRAVKEALAE